MRIGIERMMLVLMTIPGVQREPRPGIRARVPAIGGLTKECVLVQLFEGGRLPKRQKDPSLGLSVIIRKSAK